LQDQEVKHLLLAPPAALVLIRLLSASGLTSAPRFSARFLSWWRGLLRRQDANQAPVEEEPLWIRTEQHHLG
jgi:hypothetical protein